MKKILSLLLSVVLFATMSITAFAAVVEEPSGWMKGWLKDYTGKITIETIDDLDAVYDKWKTGDTYDNYELIWVMGDITISKSYDFTKDNGTAISFLFSKPVTINEGATLKADEIEFWDAGTNNGTIVLTQPDNKQGAFNASYSAGYSQGLTNNGTIKMLNTDKIVCYSNTVDTYPIINNGVIQTPSGKVSCSTNGQTNANGDVLIDPVSTGSIQKIPEINSPDTTGDTPLTMSGVAIPAPTYTVTIPTTIEFADAKRVLAETPDNKKLLNTDFSVTAITNNLFVNEKQLTVSVLTDLTMTEKDGDTLAYTVKLADEQIAKNTAKTILTVSPSAAETEAETNTIALTATLDQSTIKKASTYNGTVTFTVALSDIA